MAIKDEYIPLGVVGQLNRVQARRSGRRRAVVGALIVLGLILAIPLLLTFGGWALPINAFGSKAAVSVYTGGATISDINSKVVLMYKTGHSVIYERIPVQLLEPRPDIPNRIVYSDVALRMGSYDVVDTLFNMSETHRRLDEFNEYSRLNRAKQNHISIEPTTMDWDLDRFKFAPMVTDAWKRYPNATWYIGVDGDSFLFWSTLLRWLDRYFDQPEVTPWYLGYDEVGDKKSSKYFAHGGAGFIMSQGLLRQIYRNDPNGTNFINDPRFDFIRCGDCALGDYISDLPGRTGHTDAGRDLFHHDGLEKLIFRPRLWHAYLISLHHNSPAQLTTLRQWERHFLPTIPAWDGVRQCDVLYGLAPAFLREPLHRYIRASKSANATLETSKLNRTVVRAAWRAEEVDSFECGRSCLAKYGKGGLTEANCDRACDAHPNCFGWQLSNEACTLTNRGFRIGAPVDPNMNIRTAWRLDRIAALEAAMPCSDPAFRKLADRTGFGLVPGRADFTNTGLDAGWRPPRRPEAGELERNGTKGLYEYIAPQGWKSGVWNASSSAEAAVAEVVKTNPAPTAEGIEVPSY